MGFRETDERFELSGSCCDAFLRCAWVITHIAHVEVRIDKFVARLFSYDWVYFGAGIVDVGRKLRKRLRFEKR